MVEMTQLQRAQRMQLRKALDLAPRCEFSPAEQLTTAFRGLPMRN